MKHLDRLFLYALISAFLFHLKVNNWWAPLLMLPLILWDAISALRNLKKEKKNERQ